MTRLYYREMRRRAGTLEARLAPEQEILPTYVMRGEDGLPMWVFIPAKFDWTRTEGEPIPPKILALLEPEVRAAYEAREEIGGQAAAPRSAP